MKRLVIVILSVTIAIWIFLFIKRSIPYSDRAELLSANISIDSIWSIGPATTIYDKSSQKYYWLKSLTSLDQTTLDTLKSRKANIRYMKFLMGPLENRIFRMEVDSLIVVDQVVERE
jgi:hypothetical protein